jgi:hypothetical protein
MDILILLVSTAVVAVVAFLMICLLIDLVPKAEEKAPEPRKAATPSTRTFPTIARAVGTWTRVSKRGDGPASQTPPPQ